ncbi:protein DpdG [Microvirga aerophila]|uniref:Uncharacterized protein n=1 Tax=Microvirga aerophila TaxID=670291 RepID=A0A512BL28_9HYPH|nr:protein DpdG [Microvirga aerophila]GEO12618.1 hypothetical protein MAE02_03140 [Microvirga aerophila]
MSVLNQASDGLFNVLIVLARALIRFGPHPREELLAACGGDVQGVDPGHLTRTLNRWTELGLFGTDGGMVVMCEPFRSALNKSADDVEDRLPRIVRTIALAPQNNARLWESEESKSADLSRGIAWMLAQDVYTIDTTVDRLAELEAHQLIDRGRPIVQNNTRWNGLRTWMVYLGFARHGTPWTIDPTVAVRDSLAEIFGPNQQLTAPAFVERVAAVLPVMDGGLYRAEVEGALKDAAWFRMRPGLISTSLSRAIQRLDREGYILVEQRSDAEGSVTLTGYDQRQWRDITHVSLKYAKRAS